MLADLTTTTPAYEPIPSQPCFLPDDVCALFQYDGYTLLLAIYACIQLSWATLLLCMQSYQISRQVTTNEQVNGTRYNSSYEANTLSGAGVLARLAAGVDGETGDEPVSDGVANGDINEDANGG